MQFNARLRVVHMTWESANHSLMTMKSEKRDFRKSFFQCGFDFRNESLIGMVGTSQTIKQKLCLQYNKSDLYRINYLQSD